MARGVAYCKNKECDLMFKPVIMITIPKEGFFCYECKEPGRITSEKFSVTGKGEEFKEVRLEFMYDVQSDKYKGLAIIKDEHTAGNKVYNYSSPLIMSENRGMKAAEIMLGVLRTTDEAKLDPRDLLGKGMESLDISDPWPLYLKKLEYLEKKWSRI